MTETAKEPVASGADLCERIASSALDQFIAKLIVEMNHPDAVLSVEDVRALGQKFKDEDAKHSIEHFRGQLDEYLRELEKEIWDQTRRRPFDRMLVKLFSHLFPPEGGLDIGEGVLSRRILPGFFQAIEQLAGPMLFEQCQDACKGIAKAKKKVQGRRLHWDELYKDEDASRLVDDILVVVATHFEDFHKRCKWLYILIDSHLAPAEDYDFEGEAVHQWSLSEEGVLALLQALFSHFRERLAEEAERARIAERYGEKACSTIEAVIGNIDQALAGEPDGEG